MVGREREITAILQEADELREGRGAVVLLSGETGVGKTRVAESALARSGLRYFAAHSMCDLCPPYAPILDILREWHGESPSEVEGLGDRMAALGRLLPEWGRVSGGPPSAEELIEALASAVLAIGSARPSAILLDDLHASDTATLDLLAVVANRIKRVPLLCVGTYRADEVPREHPLRRLRTSLRKTRRFTEIHLTGLGADDCVRLMTACLGAEPDLVLSQMIYDRSQGVPLFVEELCAALQAEDLLQKGDRGIELIRGGQLPVPGSIRDALRVRVDRLSPVARSLLETAAVAGAEFDLGLIAGRCGEAGLDEAMEAGFIEEAGRNRGRFRRTLVREAVLSEMTWSRRRELNRDLALILAKAGAPPEQLVGHYLAMGDDAGARGALLAVAARCCEIHAHEDAFRAFERALELWPAGESESDRVAALHRYVDCARSSGHLNEALRGLRELLECPQTRNHGASRGRIRRSLAGVYALQGSLEPAMEAHREAAGDFMSAELADEAAGEWFAVSEIAVALVRTSEAKEACARAGELSAGTGNHGLHSRSLSQLAFVSAMRGEKEEARKHIEAGLTLALKHDLTEEAAESYRKMASTLEYASDYHREVEAFGEAMAYCSAQGADMQRRLCMGCLSYALFRAGEWKQCLRTARDVLKDADSLPVSRLAAMLSLSLVHLHRGEAKPARKLITELDRKARDCGVVLFELFTLWELAQLSELEDDPQRAGEYYGRLLDTWETTEDRHEVLPGLRAAAGFFADRDRVADVNRCSAIAGRIVSVSGNPEATATLSCALAEAARLQGNLDESLEHYLRAHELVMSRELTVDAIRTGWRAGKALVEVDRLEAGLRLLEESLGLARRLGARPFALQIGSLLAGCGVPLNADEGASGQPWQRLTQRQREVARGLADGQTNKEIASNLHLSTRTVDMHVRHIFDRLDCRTRSEAVRKLLQNGVPA